MPAALAILGDRAWWPPRWLGWLPRLTIEPPATSGPDAPAPAAEPGRGGIPFEIAETAQLHLAEGQRRRVATWSLFHAAGCSAAVLSITTAIRCA